MKPKLVKIKGARGRWLAEAEGQWLPVLHQTWRLGTSGYLDPMSGVNLASQRYLELVEALRTHDLAIVQRDKGENLDRDGYIGIFHFRDLAIGPDGSITLQLVARYADPAK